MSPKEISQYLLVLVFAGSAFYLFTIKKARFFYIDSRSMEPTLKPGDRMMAIKTSAIKRGDIVNFQDTRNPEECLVKRMIGLPGDEVEIKEGKLYLNQTVLSESYLNEEKIVYRYGPAIVPENHFFVLGDNRNYSDDSTVWGFVPAENIRCKTIFIYWPFSRAGKVH